MSYVLCFILLESINQHEEEVNEKRIDRLIINELDKEHISIVNQA